VSAFKPRLLPSLAWIRGHAPAGRECRCESRGQERGSRTPVQWRLGKVDLSQVGVFLAYSNVRPTLEAPVWTWVEGALFLPAAWFGPAKAADREQLGIPPDRQFQTKVELGWEMIQRVQARGLPFAAL
jgi:SRSO17 transposase